MPDKNVIEVFNSLSALCYFECRELFLFCGRCFHLHLKLHGNNLSWTELPLRAVSHHQVNGCISMSPWYISTLSLIKHSVSCERTLSVTCFWQNRSRMACIQRTSSAKDHLLTVLFLEHSLLWRGNTVDPCESVNGQKTACFLYLLLWSVIFSVWKLLCKCVYLS